MQTHFLDRV